MRKKGICPYCASPNCKLRLSDFIGIKQKNQPAKLTICGSLPIAVASIRSNFELWRKGEITDGQFSFHLQNNLLRIEALLDKSNK